MQRVLTAFLFAGSVTAGLILSEESTLVVLMALAGLSAYEFYGLFRGSKRRLNEILGTAISALFPLSYSLYGFFGMLGLVIILAVALLVWYVFDERSNLIDVAITLFGALYTGFLLTALLLVRLMLPGIWGGLLAWGVVLSTWANDAFAFWVGSRIGKHKINPKISPHKSWEGLIAGIVGSVIVWMLMLFIPDFPLPIWLVPFVGIICGIFCILGDLVESRVKRETKHKDSSNLLPGHGGFLDRLDSLFLVSGAAFLILWAATTQFYLL